VGFKDPVEFYRHFRLYRVRMLPAMTIVLLLRPWLVIKVLRNAARVSKDAHTKSDSVVELASICSIVHKRHVGTSLLKAFMLRAQEMGARDVTLTTDEQNNLSVRSFYERHGFILSGWEQRGDRVLVSYSISI